MKMVREIPKGHRRDKPLVFKDERLIEETRNIDGEPALILWSKKGWYILREWDKFHGWGDRAYRTLAEATRYMHGPLKTEGNMAGARKNAAAGAEKVVIAFLAGRKAREGSRPDYMRGARYETDGTSLVQWGSVIARKVNGTIEITDAGWRTKTTMAMLNSVLRRTAANASIYQKRHEWFLSTPGGVKPWAGKAVISVEGMSVQANKKKSRAARKSFRRRQRPWYVSLYRTSRDYGGPEEGGWWYGTGEPLKWQVFDTRAQAEKFREKFDAEAAAWKKRYSWPGDDKLAVRIERHHPRPWPEYRPHYENNRRGGGARNPLSRAEAARALRWAKSEIGEGRRTFRDGLVKIPAYSFGRARGVAGVVRVMGPKAAREVAIKMGERAERGFASMKGVATLSNPLSCLKNLHTARERAYAKKLITRYWIGGKAALVKGQMEKAAHAYGALAAIRRIARFELPHAQTVANLASFRMDLLRRSAKDLARYRGSAR